MDPDGEGVAPFSRRKHICDSYFQVRSRDPDTGLLVQAGGQTVVEYLTAKNSLIQVCDHAVGVHHL